MMKSLHRKEASLSEKECEHGILVPPTPKLNCSFPWGGMPNKVPRLPQNSSIRKSCKKVFKSSDDSDQRGQHHSRKFAGMFVQNRPPPSLWLSRSPIDKQRVLVGRGLDTHSLGDNSHKRRKGKTVKNKRNRNANTTQNGNRLSVSPPLHTHLGYILRLEVYAYNRYRHSQYALSNPTAVYKQQINRAT